MFNKPTIEDKRDIINRFMSPSTTAVTYTEEQDGYLSDPDSPIGCGVIVLLTTSRSLESLGKDRTDDILVRQYSLMYSNGVSFPSEAFSDDQVINPDKGDTGTAPEWNELIPGLQPSISMSSNEVNSKGSV